MRRNAAKWLGVVAGSSVMSAGVWAQSVEEPPASVAPAPEPAPVEQPPAKPAKPAEPEGIVDPAAKERLEKATKATLALKGLTFKIKFYAEGDNKDLVGTSEALVVAARDSGGTWVYRVTGKGQRTGKTPATSFDIAYVGVNAEWLDSDAKKVFVRPVSQMKGKAVEGSSILTRLLRDLLGPSPLGDETRAKNLSLKDDEKLDGIDCESVLATGVSGTGSLRGGELTIVMGKSDHLPRKFVRETTSSRGTTRMVYELSEVKPDDPAATVEAVHVTVPEGFTREEQAPPKPPAAKPPKPESESSDPGSPTAVPVPGTDGSTVTGPTVADPETVMVPPAEPPVKPMPTVAIMPEVDLKDASGKTVSTSSWRGSPTVVVIWGSWSLTSRKVLPEVEQLAGELGDKAKVVAVAVRQKNFADAFKAASDAGLSKAVVLADGDKLAEQVHASEYPTVLVLTAEGEIRRPSMQGKPSGALAGVRAELASILGMPGLAPMKTAPNANDTSPIDGPAAPKPGDAKPEEAKPSGSKEDSKLKPE